MDTFELVFYTCAYFFVAIMLMLPVTVEYFDHDIVERESVTTKDLRERRLWCLAMLVWPLSIAALVLWTIVRLVRSLVWAVTGK